MCVLKAQHMYNSKPNVYKLSSKKMMLIAVYKTPLYTLTYAVNNYYLLAQKTLSTANQKM